VQFLIFIFSRVKYQRPQKISERIHKTLVRFGMVTH